MMLVKSVSSFNFSNYCSSLNFKGNEVSTPKEKSEIKDDNYYTMRASRYFDLYYECCGAGCDDDEIVEANEKEMKKIENEFKAANRRIRDYIPKNEGLD
ncbi:MAG: hypothetical protein E7Z90_04295 [Cyanobacteria bacterium SIG29]|nr:hypothetical protein [Cyanobacteria bacterium SIG29]